MTDAASLQGRVALVTGGSQGVGNGIAEALAEAGATVYVTGRTANVPYGVSKAATDKMTQDMAHELREHGVAVVSLYPGLVRTEKVWGR